MNTYDRKLAEKHPLTFLVAEDNKINRKLLVSMLGKLGYKDVFEAFDGKEAVRVMREVKCPSKGGKQRKPVDVILMDLWMPEMDGYEATEHILNMYRDDASVKEGCRSNTLMSAPIVLAVSADVTDEAINRAAKTGMEGFMTKPYKLMDLQKLIVEFCIRSEGVPANG
jgi:CheY-like chemotaxis protein